MLVPSLWPKIEALLPRIPDPHDRRYVHIKGLGGVATALAVQGDTRTAQARASELIEIGNRTGNCRAVAMAHCALVAMHTMLGNQREAIEAAAAAASCEADPVYALASAVWSSAIEVMWGDANVRSRPSISINH